MAAVTTGAEPCAQLPDQFAERDHANIVSWSEFDRGSHWAAHDAPDLLLTDLRQFFRTLR